MGVVCLGFVWIRDGDWFLIKNLLEKAYFTKANKSYLVHKY
jgi:hypothetical protein